MAEPSEEQRAEAQRLVDEHADAARADLRPVDERYTARARLLRSGALEVEFSSPIERTYLIDREGKILAEDSSFRWLSIGSAFASGGRSRAIGRLVRHPADAETPYPVSQPEGKRRRIHLLEEIADLPQSDDEGNGDSDDDGDSD